MGFDLRAGSADIRTPVHSFPGDECIGPDTYRQTIFCGYLSSIATVVGAARGYRLALDATTFERWKRIGAAAGLLDDFLDDPAHAEPAWRLYDEGLQYAFDASADVHPPAWADPRLEPAVRLLRNSVRVLPERTIATLVEASRRIGAAARRKAACTTVADYVRVMREEAAHSSTLIHGSVAESVRTQAGFAAFARWCGRAIELGILADGTWDLWSDSREGRTGVKPTLVNSARIATRALRPARAMSRPRPNRRATLRALYARLRFSLLPTGVAMRRYAVR